MFHGAHDLILAYVDRLCAEEGNDKLTTWTARIAAIIEYETFGQVAELVLEVCARVASQASSDIRWLDQIEEAYRNLVGTKGEALDKAHWWLRRCAEVADAWEIIHTRHVWRLEDEARDIRF